MDLTNEDANRVVVLKPIDDRLALGVGTSPVMVTASSPNARSKRRRGMGEAREQEDFLALVDGTLDVVEGLGNLRLGQTTTRAPENMAIPIRRPLPSRSPERK